VCLLNYRKDGSTFINQFFLSPIKVGHPGGGRGEGRVFDTQLFHYSVTTNPGRLWCLCVFRVGPGS